MGESIMKKFGKRILALGVALGVICGISSVAFAASSLSPTIGGYKAYATATIEEKNASASTTYTGSGSVSVNSKYIVTQYNSNKQKTLTGSKGSYGTVKLSFKAPNEYQSKRITTTHKVFATNQSWTGTTKASTWVDIV